MHKILGKKAVIVGAVAALAFVLSAGAALASAPVLPVGTTTGPNMSGKCTNCHTYATAATTTTPAKAKAKAKPKPKATKLSHPYASKVKHSADTTFTVWGYVTPRLPRLQEATLTVGVEQSMGHGSWAATSSLSATGTISSKGKFKGKTNYTAKLHIPHAGRYRLRTQLVYNDAKGVRHTKWSKLFYIRIY
jgi:hypothetical protein